MNHLSQRCVQIGNWIFEIKAVRAIRAPEYGQPYSAVANFQLNGDNVFIDSLMTANGNDFCREDFDAIRAFCQKLDVKQVDFDRYKQGQCQHKSIIVPSSDVVKKPQLKLVHG